MMNLEKEIREQPAVLSHVLDENLSTVRAIVAEAKAAGVKHIYFAARGTSDHACVYAQYLFGILAGIPCTLGTPSVFTKYGAHVDLSDSLVIGVSQSGRAADCIAVLDSAKADGAITVAVTNNTDSPMAAAAKYHLYCAAGPEVSIAATKTFTAQALLLASLAAVWAGNDTFLTELKNVYKAVNDLLTNGTNEIEALAEKYKTISGAIVLGRGVSYPIALEGALKMLETNKLRMKGYPVSDFHHGPVAQVKPGDLMILLAPTGVCFDDCTVMAKKLVDIGADVLVLTDGKSGKIDGTSTLILPFTGSELTAPFVEVLVFQMLACKMTEKRGIDPDLAGVINKITITK